jgi:tetratricopeptide (TPR) repeat protein
LSHAAALEHLRAGRPQAAAALLEAHLRSEDADAQGWFLLGASRHALNDLSGAAAAFARSLVLDPTHREAHLANISVLRAARDAQGALTAAQQALTRFPHDGRVLYAAALCLDDLGQADAALVHYDGALAIEPSFWRASAGTKRLKPINGAISPPIPWLDAPMAPSSTYCSRWAVSAMHWRC